MPANVDTMAYTAERGTPWHGLGTPLEGLSDKGRMIVAAGLNWSVVRSPIVAMGDGSLEPVKVPGFVATRRSDTGAPLGIVSERYAPTHNEALFDFVDALVDDGSAKYDTAGALDGGKVVWVLAETDASFHVDGDNGDHKSYLLATTGHDGRRPFIAANVLVRVVCQNTLDASLKGAQQTFKVRHTASVMERVGEARRALNINLKYTETMEQVLTRLMAVKMDPSDVVDFTEALLPIDDDVERKARVQNERDAILAVYRNSANLDGVPGSAFRAFQAVAEYFDHEKTYRAAGRRTQGEARALAVLDGTAHDAKARALGLLLPTR